MHFYMIRLKSSLPCFFVLFCLISCSPPATDIHVQSIAKMDYVDKITMRGTIEAIKTHNINSPPEIYKGLIQYIIPEGTYVEPGDTVAIIESRETVNDFEDALKRLEVAKSEYNQTKAELDLDKAQLMAQIKTIEKSVLISDLDSVLIQFTTPSEQRVIQLGIEKARIEKQRMLKKLNLLESIQENELKTKEIMIRKMENRMSKARNEMDKLVLTTDVGGFVMHHVNRRTRTKIKEGDAVRRKTPIVQIPDVSAFQVKIMALEADYKKIKSEQSVRIFMNAYPNLHLDGKIDYIAPVGIPIKRNSEIKQFEILADLDSSNLSIEPGISANCDIVINHIEDTLVVPMVAIFNEDSMQYIYKKQGKTFIRQPVEIAVDNNLEAVVKAGIKANDVIALQKPPGSLVE